MRYEQSPRVCINSHTTLRRAFRRNQGQRGLRYKQADDKASERRLLEPQAIKLTDPLEAGIKQGLKRQWSPEHICGRLQ